VSGAAHVIERFWSIQDAGDYTAVADLFAPDAELVDPIYGTFHGAEIPSFLERMNEVMHARGVRFEALEIAGGDTVAWSRWVAHTPDGHRYGIGLYRVADGLITFYRDALVADHPVPAASS